MDIDAHAEVQFDPRLCMRLDGLGITALVIALVIEFLLELFITQRLWQIVTLQPRIQAASHLFDGQLSRVVLIQSLPDATA